MVVAVRPVTAVNVAGDDVIDVPRMRNHRVAAADAVDMIGRVAAARMAARARVGVVRRGEQFVFVDVLAVNVVKMSVVHVIDVVVVPDTRMPAINAVAVLVLVVNVMFHDVVIPV